MKISNLIKLVGIMLAFAVVACGPSSEGEKKAWAKHQKNATTFKTEYANFAATIDTSMASAKTEMDTAMKVGDEEKKAKAMQLANGTATKVVGNLSKIKTKISDLDAAMTKLGKIKVVKAKSGIRTRAFDTGNTAISEVRAAIASAAPANVEDAETLLKAQLSSLSSAQSTVDSAISSVKPKSKKKKKKKKKKKN